MILTDFYYAGKLLSDLGCIVAYNVTSSSTSISMGSEMEFDTVTNQITWETDNLKANYKTPVTATFDIFKYSCEKKVQTFTDIECSHIMQWLNQKKVSEFIPIYDDNNFDSIFFMGTFTNIKQINIAGDCVGFTVTFTSTAPWGFERDRTQEYALTSGGGSFTIINDSDETGFLFPKLFTIKIKEAGDFIMQNTLDNRNVVIKNCTEGEIISFNCKRQLITSNYYQIGINEVHSSIMNDFNYNFPRLVNTLEDYVNIFSVNLSCEISITYNPVRKVGILV